MLSGAPRTAEIGRPGELCRNTLRDKGICLPRLSLDDWERLDLRDQLRLLNVGDRYFHRVHTGLPALAVLLYRRKVESDHLAATSRQPALPMPVVADRLECLDLDQAAGKTLKLFRCGQFSIQARRADFERVFRTWNQIFHVQQDTEVAAEFGAVLMCDAGKMFDAHPSLYQAFWKPFFAGGYGRFQLRTFLCIFFKRDAKDSFLVPSAEFSTPSIQPVRSGGSRGCPPDFVQHSRHSLHSSDDPRSPGSCSSSRNNHLLFLSLPQIKS